MEIFVQPENVKFQVPLEWLEFAEAIGPWNKSVLNLSKIIQTIIMD